VTSSFPIVTRNAINFTPDNKRVYAYSGVLNVKDTGSSFLTAIDFETNSEYLDLFITLMDGDTWSSGQQLMMEVKLNDIIVIDYLFRPNTAYNDNFDSFPIPLLVPPFSHCEILVGSNIDANHNVTCHVIGHAFGMTETGYQ